MAKKLTEDDVLARLQKMIDDAGTQGKAARKLGISQSFLSQVMTKQRPVPKVLLMALKLERVEYFQEMPNA